MGNDAGDNGGINSVRVNVLKLHKLREPNGIFICCALSVRVNAPLAEQRLAIKNSKDCVRITCINCKEHIVSCLLSG